MRRMGVVVLLLAGILLAAQHAVDPAVPAQPVGKVRVDYVPTGVPQHMNLQGYLTDTSGAAITDTLQMVFKIWRGGSAVWTETQNNCAVLSGLFSAGLGSATPVPFSVFEPGTACSLQVTVDGDTLPKVEITSVGFAYRCIKSDTADYASNGPTPQYVDSAGGACRVGGLDIPGLDGRFVNVGEDAGGDLTGTYPSPTVDGLQGHAVSSANPNPGQVLKWLSGAWTPASDSIGTGFPGYGSSATDVSSSSGPGSSSTVSRSDHAHRGVRDVLAGTGISVSGDPDHAVTFDQTWGDSRYVNEGQANSVTTAMITDGQVQSGDMQDGAVTMPKLNQSAATTGQVIKWTGSAWAPRNDSIGTGFPGYGTSATDVSSSSGPGSSSTVSRSDHAHKGVRDVLAGTGISVSGDPDHTVTFDQTWGDSRYVNHSGDVGNGNGQVPVSNGTVCTNLNADMLDGSHSNSFAPVSHTHTGSDLVLPLSLTVSSSNPVVTVTNTGSGNGFRVASASQGLAVTSTTYDGIYIGSTGSHGIEINSAGDDGLHVSNATNQGIDVKGKGSWVESNNASAYGLTVCSYAAQNSNPGLHVYGTSYFEGAKTGYVADLCLNDGPDVIEPGDVVTISGAAPPVLGEVPVIRVRKARAAQATGVAGVADVRQAVEANSEMSPTGLDVPRSPETAVRAAKGPINPGDYLLVVTLGSYKQANVEASGGPVRPGDLLVSSGTAGYAMRADSPAPGTVVGRALGSLDAGSGKIPVMITLR